MKWKTPSVRNEDTAINIKLLIFCKLYSQFITRFPRKRNNIDIDSADDTMQQHKWHIGQSKNYNVRGYTDSN